MSSVVKFPQPRSGELEVQPGIQTVSRPVRLLYSVAETAELLGLGLSSIYDLINEGDLPKVMVGTRGKTTRVAADDIQAYIDNRRVEVKTSWVI